MRQSDSLLAEEFRARFCAAKLTQAASVWVEENVTLDEPKIKGRFSFLGREYLRELMDAWGPLPPSLAGTTDFAGCLSTGAGKTITTIGGLAYRIGCEPTRGLVVKPTMAGPAGARTFSKTRLSKMIRATNCLREKIPTGQERFDFSTCSMIINGSVLDFTGSNSVGQLGENRCDVVLQDELDKYPPQTETSKEANPIYLADERTKSVYGARRYKFSTPTLNNTGIWEWFMRGDQRRWFVPCVHCHRGTEATEVASGHGQTQKGWMVLAWSKQFTVFAVRGDEAFIKWSDEARRTDGSWDLAEVTRTAHFECPWCKGKILDRDKLWMNQHGRWQATAPGTPGYVSWHLPSMYSISSDCNYGAMAKKFLLAKRSLDGAKGFINSDLAEPDVSQAITVNKAGIIGKHLEITGEWLKIISADYHANAPFFWADCVAYNGSDAAHFVEYRSFNNWSDLDQMCHDHGVIKEAVVIDCGFEQAEVYRECCALSLKREDGAALRCELGPAVQDGLPEIIGWQPAKSAGGQKFFRVTDPEGNVLYQPWRKDKFVDPFVGTSLAREMRIPILEWLENPLEDMLQNVLEGKTALKWSISKEADTEEFHRHLASKVKKPWKKNPRDLRWQSVAGRDDHIRVALALNLALAMSFKVLNLNLVQVKGGEAATEI